VFSVLGLDQLDSIAVVVAFLLGFSAVAGFVGGLLGVGGGLFLVPMLILLFGVPPSVAIAASLVAVIATSSGAASTYVGAGLADIRVGMFLEVATAVGGLAGALITVELLAQQQRILVFAFVPAVLFPAALMLRQRKTDIVADPPPDALADRLRLHGVYFDETSGTEISYRVTGTSIGLFFSGLAGLISGLLGIGGGTFYVPALNTFMNVPVRVASATSNFMIGVTATASAIVYLLGGQIALFWTAPIVLGILAGSRLAPRYHASVPTERFKGLFAALLVLAAALMLLRGVGVV
jgi:uncharacterized membrane protein YfcA